jgi:tRNA nucleotidyltransferase (CCA-adding enzyme)
MKIPHELREISDSVFSNGGRCLVVGGAVRDAIMGILPKDYDVEVYGISLPVLAGLLRKFGSVNMVGESFGIIKLRGEFGEYDFSLPRRENRIGVKHTDFEVMPDPNMTVAEAASRRDFTINSMAYDIHENKLVDEFNGNYAISCRALEPTSEAFKEDSLRILRGMQFAARFDMSATTKCKEYSRQMLADYSSLAKERIWGEWEKWALKGDYPAAGLQFLVDTGWIALYNHLFILMGCPQDKIWHPEGDVWIHTLHVVDAMARICRKNNIVGENRTVLMFAALCHDMGKPGTTVIGERITSRGHCEAGVPIAEEFLQSIGCPQSIIDKVKPLVAEHLVHVIHDITPRTVRRLSVRLFPANIIELCHVIDADMQGRPPLSTEPLPSMILLLGIAENNAVLANKPKPIIMGRHLLELGHDPGPIVGRIVKAAYIAQLDGLFEDLESGLVWVDKQEISVTI